MTVKQFIDYSGLTYLLSKIQFLVKRIKNQKIITNKKNINTIINGVTF